MGKGGQFSWDLQLLTFIEKHFNRYFNLDEKIPESYKTLMQTEFRQNLKMLTKQYKNANMDPVLLELIMTTFQKFIKANRSKNISYRELLYLKTLNKEFAEFLIPNENATNQKNMIDLLQHTKTDCKTMQVASRTCWKDHNRKAGSCF